MTLRVVALVRMARGAASKPAKATAKHTRAAARLTTFQKMTSPACSNKCISSEANEHAAGQNVPKEQA